MDSLEDRWVSCPYCGERIEIVLDRSVKSQNYIEDCEVCCRPMKISVERCEDGTVSVDAIYEE